MIYSSSVRRRFFNIISPYFKATLGGGATRRPPPPQSKILFNFMHFFWKIWQNRMLAPSGGSAPPTGNPGSSLNLSTTATSLETRDCLNESGF